MSAHSACENNINPDSAAFIYGQGFFTTTRIIDFKPLWLEQHMLRLSRWLQKFAMPGFDKKVMKAMARQWPVDHAIRDGFMRIMVWEDRGRLNFHFNGGNTQVVTGASLTKAFFQRHSSQPLLNYKSFNYWESRLAWQEASKRGFFEALLVNENHEICEGSRCNIFWVKEGQLRTPDETCGLLPGIGREIVLEIASQTGIWTKVGKFLIEELDEAEEIFLTNSLRGIIPVTRWERKEYEPGAITKTFIQAWELKMEDYLRKY